MVTMALAQAFSPALLCWQIKGQDNSPVFLPLGYDLTERWVILTSLFSDLTSSHIIKISKPPLQQLHH